MLSILVLISYSALMLGATFLFTRKAKDSESFHVADRNIGTVASAFSIAATWIWAPSLFVSGQQAYTNGFPGFLWFLVPNVLCLMLFIPFAKRIRARYPQGVTLSGFMAKTYKSDKVKGVYSFQLGALAVLSTAVQLLAGSKMLNMMTGLPFWLLTIILSAIAYSYSQFSGIRASVATDVVQLILILLGITIIVPMIMTKTGGIDTWTKGLSSVTGQYTAMFDKPGMQVFLSFGLPTTVGLLSGPFGDQCFWQRAFATNEKGLAKAFFLGALLFALVPIGMGSVGFLAAGNGFKATDPSMVNFEFIKSMLPGWVMVPFLYMVLSGLLSTVDSNLCAAASMTTDLKGGSSVEKSRLTMLALLGIAIGIANIPGLTVTMLFLFYGTLRATTLLPTVLTLLNKRLTAKGAYTGVLASLCLGLPIFAYGSLTNNPMFKTLGSLTSVLTSGIVSILLSRKGVQGND